MSLLSRLKFFILHRDSDADVSGAATAIVVVASVKQPEPVQVDDYRAGSFRQTLTQLSPLSRVDIPSRQATYDGHGSSQCRLAGLHSKSAERG
jgi:hypothetical protein